MKYTVRHRDGVERGIEAPSALEAVRKARVSAAHVIRVELEAVEPRCRCGVVLVVRGPLGSPARGWALECPGCRRCFQEDEDGLSEVRPGRDAPVAIQRHRGVAPISLVRRGGRRA